MPQDSNQTPPIELDVPRLLKASTPSQSQNRMLIRMLIFFAVASAISIWLGDKNRIFQYISSGLIALMSLGMLFFGYLYARGGRQEVESLEMIGEWVHLRQWSKAAELVEILLSSPMRTTQSRLGALMHLIHILDRFHRYSDAIEVYEHILKEHRVDDQSAYNLKAGRAMAMLRDDRLYDADKAISQLRQLGPEDSAPLISLTLYHALKTGRADDLLEVYNKRKDLLKRELGIKAAEVHAFAAAACLRNGDLPNAQPLWSMATSLVPPVELVRRFPELKAASESCRPAQAPGAITP